MLKHVFITLKITKPHRMHLFVPQIPSQQYMWFRLETKFQTFQIQINFKLIKKQIVTTIYSPFCI